MIVTLTIDATALLDAAWMARVERGERAKFGVGRFDSVTDTSLALIIDACRRALGPSAMATHEETMSQALRKEPPTL